MSQKPPDFETTTVRCEGRITDVRLLHRRLEAEGLAVTFGSYGALANDYLPPGRQDARWWFQLIATGVDSDSLCRLTAGNWSDGGKVIVL